MNNLTKHNFPDPIEIRFMIPVNFLEARIAIVKNHRLSRNQHRTKDYEKFIGSHRLETFIPVIIRGSV